MCPSQSNLPPPGSSHRPARPPGAASVCLLVPVKQLAHAKTRLSGAVADRAALMRAFAGDALIAARLSPAVARVVAVTDEPLPDLGAEGAPVEVVADEGYGDLNAALRWAERGVRLRHPELGVAAMCADLPALRTDDLTTALLGSTAARWYVADAHGTGTTLLAAGPGVDLDPHFGAGSAERSWRSTRASGRGLAAARRRHRGRPGGGPRVGPGTTHPRGARGGAARVSV